MDSGLLFVSPYSQDADSLERILADVSVSLIHAGTLKEAAKKLTIEHYPVVLTEAKLDDGTWRDMLGLARDMKAELIVTDAWADARFWAEAINLGAYDMLAQPFHAVEVKRVISSARTCQRAKIYGAKVGAAASGGTV
jgi:DNA-binding NtrC family response regulator